jgi:hypothetical protein
MAVTEGRVVSIGLGRRMGKLIVRHTTVVHGIPIGTMDHHFLVYNDGTADVTIDPTELVRRNWIIGLLTTALKDGLQVAVSSDGYQGAFVRQVTVSAPG